jgi:hypothetical protein
LTFGDRALGCQSRGGAWNTAHGLALVGVARDLSLADLKAMCRGIGAELRTHHSDALREEIVRPDCRGAPAARSATKAVRPKGRISAIGAFQAIAYARFRHQELWLAWIGLDLPAQLSDQTPQILHIPGRGVTQMSLISWLWVITNPRCEASRCNKRYS